MAVTYADSPMRSTGTPFTELLKPDLEPGLHIATWEETFLQRIMATGSKPTDRKYVWYADNETHPSSVPSAREGVLYSELNNNLTTVEPTPLANYIHHYAQGIGVSDLAREFVTTWGGDEWSYQEAREFRTAHRAREYVLLHSTPQAGTTGMGGDAPKTCGLVRWALSSGFRTAAEADSIAGAAVPVALCSFGEQRSTGAPVTQPSLNAFLGTMKEGGADPSRMFMLTGIAGQQLANQWLRVYDTGAGTHQPIYQFTRSLGERMAGASIQWFQHDFGIVGLIVHQYMNSGATQSVNPTGTAGDFSFAGNDAYLFVDPTVLKWRPVQTTDTKMMGTNGLLESAIISWAGGLQVNNPKQLGLICNIDGS